MPGSRSTWSTGLPALLACSAAGMGCAGDPAAPDPAPATPSPAATPAAAPAAAAQRQVTVNHRPIPAGRLAELEASHGLTILDGDYWYDRASGAAGRIGGPTLSFIVPGLDLGGPLPSDASAGNTGVYINGRELPQHDLVGLMRLVGHVAPGRYFLDALGNAGLEGGPPLVNLVVASQQAQRNGNGDGWYSATTGAGGNESGGAGYVMGKDGSGNTWISSY